jgi:hypothetical protein
MPNHHRKSVSAQPSPDKIAVYLSDARQTTDEKRRVAGVRALHVLLLRWRAEAREAEAIALAAASGCAAALDGFRRHRWRLAIADPIGRRREHWETPCDKDGLGAPRNFEPMLRIFFEHAGRAIFASPAPLAAMRVFWDGKSRGVGRPPEDNAERANAERDFALAIAVQEQVYAGATNEKAINAVANNNKDGLKADSIHKIYYRLREEVREELARRALVESWRSGQEWDWSAFVEAPLPNPE